MTRRIDIELTSDRGDGTWTWRAAGAKLPKGTVETSALYDGAQVGDVCRADADFALDGVFLENVLPPKARSGRKPDETIELIGRSFEGGVTTTWKERKGGDKGKAKGRGRGRDRDREGGGDGPRSEGGDKSEGGRRERGDRRPRREPREAREERPKPKRLRPGRAHRQAWIDSLPEEQKVVAEQLSRGGLQAVRKEIDVQNEKAKADGTNPIDGSALVALAETLMPKLRDAEWRDRAEAALADIDEIDLRDLRSVVAAESAHDKESRELANQLRDGLNARVERAQAEWVDEVASTLADGWVVRALRVSSRSPKAGARLPDDLLQRLIEATNSSVTAETGQQRLATVLDAVSRSVVRPHFKLEHVPEKPSDELLETVRKVASQLPEVATQFGVTPSRRPRRAKKPPAPPAAPAAPAQASEAAPASEAAAAPEALPAAETHEALPAAEAHEALPAAEAHEALPAAEAAEAAESAPAPEAAEAAESAPAPEAAETPEAETAETGEDQATAEEDNTSEA